MSSKASSSIRNVKHVNAGSLKKNLIQSMLTNKLSTATNVRVRVREEEPSVKLDTSSKKGRLLSYNTHSGQTSDTKSSYIPKYRNNFSKEKLKKDLERMQKAN